MIIYLLIKDIQKKTGDKYWIMQVVFTGLTESEARVMEQSLICIYTFDALSNARYEISVKNIEGFESEVTRMASLLKIDESGLWNIKAKTIKIN